MKKIKLALMTMMVSTLFCTSVSASDYESYARQNNVNPDVVEAIVENKQVDAFKTIDELSKLNSKNGTDVLAMLVEYDSKNAEQILKSVNEITEENFKEYLANQTRDELSYCDDVEYEQINSSNGFEEFKENFSK